MGSGGGGGAGKVSYPDYLQTAHGELLSNSGEPAQALPVTVCMSVLVPAAIAANPYDVAVNTGATAYNPSSYLTDMEIAIADLSTMINSYDEETNWASHLKVAKVGIDETLIDNKYIEDDVKTYKDLLDDTLTMTTLPRFRGGMRDINAVTSSAFAIGVAYIEASSQRDVAKYSKELMLRLNFQRNENATKSAEVMLNYAVSVGELKRALAHYTIETARLGIVASKEQHEMNLEIEDAEAKWDLEMLSYMGNAIASISGASTINTGASKPSRASSAIGGALSGAAAGAMIGGPVMGVGAIPGAIIGGIAGLAMGLTM